MIIVIVVHSLVQIALLRPALDDEVVNAYEASASDAQDYAGRAKLLAIDHDWSAAFSDAYRLPGYPMFLATFYSLTSRPRLWARYAQLILSTLMIPLAFLTVLAITGVPGAAWVAALLAAVWIPSYYFSPILCAESISLLFVAALLLCLSQLRSGNHRTVGMLCGLDLAILTYLKPNHLFMLLPVIGFFVVSLRSVRQAVSLSLYTAAVVIALMLPWSTYASIASATFVPLSTTVGVNLYEGAGLTPAFGSDGDTLPEFVTDHLHLYDDRRDGELQQVVQHMTKSGANRVYQKAAAEAWESRPWATSLLGVAKIGHAFGFSMRHKRDVVTASMVLGVVLGTLCLWYTSVYRSWCMFLWLTAGVVGLQAFFFLPNQRFRAVLFDPPAVVLVSLALWESWQRVRADILPGAFRPDSHLKR